jgi:hypothetical protein
MRIVMAVPGELSFLPRRLDISSDDCRLIDSAIFLTLAFGSLEFLVGQVVGKTWVTLLAVPFFWAFRSRLIVREAA